MIKSIAQIRSELGLTQIELAQKLGVTSRTVQNWEYGKSQPKLNEWLRLQELVNPQ
jgi:DNA-binding transcriptional regulator YiaG